MAKLVLTLSQQFQRQQKSIEALEDEVKKITVAVHQLYYDLRRMQDELHHVQSDERHEREKILLQLENTLLKFERRLPRSRDAE